MAPFFLQGVTLCGSKMTKKPHRLTTIIILLLVVATAGATVLADAADLSLQSDTETPTVAPSTPTVHSTAHIAVLIGDAVIPVGDKAVSEVFVSIRDFEPGVLAVKLDISFDPEIIQVADADRDPSNGTQISPATFFVSSQKVDLNQVDNAMGKISLALSEQGGDPVQRTESWRKVAAITWLAEEEGKSVVSIDRTTQFITSEEQLLEPDETNDGVVFSRAPGAIAGIVELQGKGNHENVLVSASLASARVDRTQADATGRFRIATSHGEGFYTLVATAPGYLSAESDRPIKVTVGTVTEVSKAILLGGDVNNDNCVDIRDLSYIAWRFESYEAEADINRDGQVDILDLSLTAGNFGQCGPTSWEVFNGRD